MQSHSRSERRYINYTSINNGHAMYWKQGKNFVDKRPWHVLDSTFANDPADKFGVLQFLGPSGPFAFGMKNLGHHGKEVQKFSLGAPLPCRFDHVAVKPRAPDVGAG